MKQYLYHYHLTLDEGKRLQLPSEFEFKSGDSVYAEPRRGEVICYDEERFKSLSSSFPPARFSGFRQIIVDTRGRIYLNNSGGLIKEVEVEGRGDHFAVVRIEGLLGVAYHNLLKILGE